MSPHLADVINQARKEHLLLGQDRQARVLAQTMGLDKKCVVSNRGLCGE
jgi:hypothetical protein